MSYLQVKIRQVWLDSCTHKSLEDDKKHMKFASNLLINDYGYLFACKYFRYLTLTMLDVIFKMYQV